MISTRQILGIRFFNGDVDEAISLMLRYGGFLVAPSGTCFVRLQQDEVYRRAILAADLTIADSSLMVVIWRCLRREKVQRISGLKYLKTLLRKLKRDTNAEIFWVLPTERARRKLLDWSSGEGLAVKVDHCHIAPRYGLEIDDQDLLALVEQRRPAHVVIAIGSGSQEKLGHYLCGNLPYQPAIHCTGAALGFITGDQIVIPDWADRFYFGWIWRLLSQPRTFIPRLSRALELPWLIWKYGQNLPPLRSEKSAMLNREP